MKAMHQKMGWLWMKAYRYIYILEIPLKCNIFPFSYGSKIAKFNKWSSHNSTLVKNEHKIWHGNEKKLTWRLSGSDTTIGSPSSDVSVITLSSGTSPERQKEDYQKCMYSCAKARQKKTVRTIKYWTIFITSYLNTRTLSNYKFFDHFLDNPKDREFLIKI